MFYLFSIAHAIADDIYTWASNWLDTRRGYHSSRAPAFFIKACTKDHKKQDTLATADQTNQLIND